MSLLPGTTSHIVHRGLRRLRIDVVMAIGLFCMVWYLPMELFAAETGRFVDKDGSMCSSRVWTQRLNCSCERAVKRRHHTQEEYDAVVRESQEREPICSSPASRRRMTGASTFP